MENLYNKYENKDLQELILIRESLAIKPNEIYCLGSNPERESRLDILTDIIMKKI